MDTRIINVRAKDIRRGDIIESKWFWRNIAGVKNLFPPTAVHAIVPIIAPSMTNKACVGFVFSADDQTVFVVPDDVDIQLHLPITAEQKRVDQLTWS